MVECALTSVFSWVVEAEVLLITRDWYHVAWPITSRRSRPFTSPIGKV